MWVGKGKSVGKARKERREGREVEGKSAVYGRRGSKEVRKEGGIVSRKLPRGQGSKNWLL